MAIVIPRGVGRETERECSACRRRTRRVRVAEQQGGTVLRLRLVIALSGAACTPAQPPPAATQQAEAKTDLDVPPQDMPIPRLEPTPVDGDCSAGPPMGELGAYAATSVKLAQPESGSVRVRSCAVWPAADHRNVIGLLEAGLLLPAFGPVKHAPMKSGIGYVVPLVDGTGRTCRGYVSQTVIDRIDARAQPEVRRFLPLPDPEGAWRGPCFPAGEAPG